MINSARLLKVGLAWMNIVYVICFVGVASIPSVRPGFMMYALHTNVPEIGRNVLTLGTFISGLVIWNIIAGLGIWLFTALYNGIKK